MAVSPVKEVSLYVKFLKILYGNGSALAALTEENARGAWDRLRYTFVLIRLYRRRCSDGADVLFAALWLTVRRETAVVPETEGRRLVAAAPETAESPF